MLDDIKDDKDLLEYWKYCISLGESTKKKWREDFRVDDLDKYWEGFQRPSAWTERDFLTINLIYANVKSQLDSFSLTPAFSIRPRRTKTFNPAISKVMDVQSELRENVLNYLLSEKSVKREIKKAVLDAYPYFGAIKIVYEPTHQKHPKAGQTIIDSTTKQPYRTESGGLEVYPEKELLSENFILSRRNPADILFDPDADSIENIRWVAERIQFTLDEVKENPLFKNTEGIKSHEIKIEEKDLEDLRKKAIGISTPLTGGNSSLDGLKGSKPDKIVYVWEIYHIDKQRIICFAEGHDKILRDDPIPPSIENHPYIFLSFILRRNSPYPIPELWHQVGPQDEYNITRNQLVIHRKRFSRKYEVRDGAIDDGEISKFEEGYDGLVIKKKTDGRIFQAIEDPPVDPAVYSDVQLLRKDFMDISGESVPDSEIARIEKAGVANLLGERMENRRGGKIESIKDFIEELGRKLMLLVEHEASLPLIIAVNGEQGQQWMSIQPKQLESTKGEFDYEVSVTSLLPRNPITERASWIAFLEFLSMNPHVGTQPTLLSKTAKMFGVEDKVLITELMRYAQAIQQQQMMQGNQAGKPSMSADMSTTLGLVRK